MASVADTGGQAPPTEPPEEVVIVRRPSLAWRLVRWLTIILGLLVIAVVGFIIWLDTDPGRRFIVERINQLELASGLDINVDRIDGSIWGDATLVNLTLADPQGRFLAVPQAQVRFEPLSFLRNNQIEIHELTIPQAQLMRLPELRSVDPNAPLIPDILLDIDALRIGRLEIAPPVTGQRHVLSIAGDIHLRESTARTNLQIVALQEPGLRGGDRVNVKLDAAPEQNRLGVELQVQAPAGGFVGSLTGIEKPMTADIRGQGTWENWVGRGQATLEGEQFADLRIQAQNGRFSFTGPIRPDLFVTGPAQRLTAPLTQLNLETTWENRRADLVLRLNSRAAAILAEGAIDFGRSQYEELKVAARLLQPGAIAPNLSGRDVRLALVLNGPMSTPRVAYDLTAARLGISERILENFRATGSARVDADRIVVPIAATASRITGLPEALGGLLTNVRLNGDLMIEGSNILSDNLRLRSDRADAVLALAFDVAEGRYNVGVQGRVNDFLVDTVGIFDITSDFDIVSRADGFGLQGRVALRSRRIFNQTAVDLLGGMATATATVALGGDGGIRFGDVRLAAPQLRITEGGGVYYPDGRIALQLRGNSTRYGAVAVNVGGTISAPRIRLEVANAGFGIGLRGISATVVATGQGYAVRAQGQSDYGAFDADVVIMSRAGPLTVQVNRLLFAGMTFAGRVQQTGAGPFAGRLSVAGRGIDGNIGLAAAGRRQAVTVNATAQDAVIPGSVAGQGDITVQRAIVDLALTLPIAGDDPFPVYAARGDVQVAGLRTGSLSIQRGRTQFAYDGLNGERDTAQFVVAGSSGVPFEVAGNADLSPRLIRAALRGTANNIPFRFVEPALIERVENDWVLRPVTVALREGQGSLRLAGRYGDGLIIQSRLDSFDIAIANALRPGLGVGGQASGSLDFFLPPGGAFPRAEARLNIRNFTRTGIAIRSVPVDISLSGALRPEGGNVAAVFRQNQAVVGRLQARLQPLPAGSGSWTQRLVAAPFSGGIRFNGPASVLTSLAGLSGHQVQGPIGIGADFSGRVNNPQLVGVVRANNLTYTNEAYGTRITNLAVNGAFDGSQLRITQLTGRAGEGTVSATGFVDFRPLPNGALAERTPIYPISIDVSLNNARLARGEDLSATATGDVRIRNTAAEPALISGRLQLAEIRYQIIRQGAAQVVNLTGVRRKGQPLVRPGEQQQANRGAAMPSAWRLDLDLVADNRVFVSGMGLESEWAANLQVDGTTTAPRLSGNINLVRGTLSLAGRRFTLDERSNITFPRSDDGRINPQLEILAVADIEDVEVQINIEGSSTNPRISFASTPSLPQDEVVSRILFGSSVTEISALQAIQLAASLNSLRGGSGGLDPLGALRSATGIDRLRILGEDDTTGRGTALAAGFYLSDDVYIEIITDARGFTATQLEIALSRSLSLLSQFGTTTGTNVNLRYSRDY